MNARIEGKLKTWNNDKGFGFIAPSNGGQDIFVHISDYPRRDGMPRVGESLTFLVALNQDGKKRAISVQRPNSRQAAPYRARSQPPARSSMGSRLAAFLVVAALATAGYKYFAPKHQVSQTAISDASPVLTAENSEAANPFRCDGRKHCSQMTSCKEARYFLNNCPNTEMDGDGDGIPCESQWCTGSFSR